MKVYHGSAELVKNPEIRKAKENTIIIDEIHQNNLYLLLPSKISWLATMLAEERNISALSAIKKIYSSKLYKKLQNESTKMWHLGPVALYEELTEELNKEL